MAEKLIAEKVNYFVYNPGGKISTLDTMRTRVYLVSQDLVSNSSQLRILTELKTEYKGSSGWIDDYFGRVSTDVYIKSGTLSINDHTEDFSTQLRSLETSYNSIPNGVWVKAFEKTVSVKHANDGTLELNLKVLVKSEWRTDLLNIYYRNITAQNIIISTLPRIAREPAITLPDKTYFGQAFTVSIAATDASFSHKLRYKIFDDPWVDISGTYTNSATITLPASLLAKIPESNNAPITLSVQTIQNGQVVGWDTQKRFNAYVHSTSRPSFTSLTITDLNSKVYNTLGAGKYVRLASQLRVKINNPQGIYGSTIKQQSVTIEKVTLQGNQVDFLNGIDKAGAVVVSATIVDSRGVSFTKTQTITLLDYYYPKLTAFFPARTGDGTNKGIEAQIVASSKVISVGGVNKNPWTITLEYSVRNKNTWTKAYESTQTIETFSQKVSAGNYYELIYAYDIRITIADKFASISSIVTVASLRAVMVLGPNNVGINKSPEEGRTLDVEGSIHALNGFYENGKPIQNFRLTGPNGGSKLSKVTTDLNSMIEPGSYFIANNAPNNPFSAWGLLEVYRHYDENTTEFMQRFTTALGYTAVRSRAASGSWYPWRYMMQQSTSTGNADAVLQRHQVTNGQVAITATGDWNNYVNTGFYMGSGLANQPTASGAHSWKYVRVTRHNDLYILQEAIDFNGVTSQYRVKMNGTWKPWVSYLDDRSIVSGSNANGRFTKFPDGTLICTHVLRDTYYDPETSYTRRSNVLWTLPIAFANTAYGISALVYDTSDIGNTYAYRLKSKSTTSLTLNSVAGSLYDKFDVHLTAIGRWK